MNHFKRMADLVKKLTPDEGNTEFWDAAQEVIDVASDTPDEDWHPDDLQAAIEDHDEEAARAALEDMVSEGGGGKVLGAAKFALSKNAQLVGKRKGDDDSYNEFITPGLWNDLRDALQEAEDAVFDEFFESGMRWSSGDKAIDRFNSQFNVIKNTSDGPEQLDAVDKLLDLWPDDFDSSYQNDIVDALVALRGAE